MMAAQRLTHQANNSQARRAVLEHRSLPCATSEKLPRWSSISTFCGISLKVISGSVITTGAGFCVLLNEVSVLLKGRHMFYWWFKAAVEACRQGGRDGQSGNPDEGSPQHQLPQNLI